MFVPGVKLREAGTRSTRESVEDSMWLAVLLSPREEVEYKFGMWSQEGRWAIGSGICCGNTSPVAGPPPGAADMPGMTLSPREMAEAIEFVLEMGNWSVYMYWSSAALRLALQMWIKRRRMMARHLCLLESATNSAFTSGRESIWTLLARMQCSRKSLEMRDKIPEGGNRVSKGVMFGCWAYER